MKTFAETRGEKPFDWNKALREDTISDEKWEEMENLAKSWVTCACGNQCSVLERTESGSPKDDILAKLGGDYGFFAAIKARDVEASLHMLSLIEQRSAFLIKRKEREIQEKIEELKQEMLVINPSYEVD